MRVTRRCFAPGVLVCFWILATTLFFGVLLPTLVVTG